MPRKVQDIVPGDRRAVRDTALEQERKTHSKLPRHMPVTPPPVSRTKHSPNRLKWLLIAFGIIVVVGAVGFIASSYYSRATFTIIPKVIPLSVNGTYVAQAVPETGALPYEVITIKGMASSTVVATNGPQISVKATGKVSFYNTSSIQPVRLIAGTRISADSGMVYLLSGTVTIPAYSKNGNTIVPGRISAWIVAEQSGQKYNLVRTGATATLKIVAYKGTAKYETIYAKLVSDITGGFVGTKKITNPVAVASSTAKLKASLTSSMLLQAKNTVPDGYIMYDGSYTTAFSQPVVEGLDRNIATISLQGTLYGILFKKTDLLAKFSSDKSRTVFGGFGYTSPGLESLQISITNLKDFSPEKKGSLIFRAKGDLKLVGTIPVEDIRKKLGGASLAATQDVFKSYGPVIESGSGELIPPWAKIPTDPKRITITVRE